MATINKIIERVDGLRRNVYSDEDKAKWILDVEGRILKEVFGKELKIEWPEDGDKELTVTAPYDSIYEYYVFCMIDWHNREFEEYNNDMIMYNVAFEDFLKQHRKGKADKVRFKNVVP